MPSSGAATNRRRLVDLPTGANIVTGWEIQDDGEILAELTVTPGSNERTLARLIPSAQ